MSQNTYGIRAENRITKKRVMITQPMSLREAEAWKPSSSTKKLYKYFRVVKYNGIYEGQ